MTYQELIFRLGNDDHVTATVTEEQATAAVAAITAYHTDSNAAPIHTITIREGTSSATVIIVLSHVIAVIVNRVTA